MMVVGAADRTARRWRFAAALTAGATVVASAALVATPAHAAGTAPGSPGANATWDESGGVEGFADATSSSSKISYTIGDGTLENVFYPTDDTPDTYGLQYYVTNGSSFTDNEASNTSHAVSLADSTSLTWQQKNTATNGDYTITKTYVADPARSVLLINTTFDNLSSTPLSLYAVYDPQLDNDGMGNTGGTDSSSGDLVASNGSVSSAMAASTGFSQTTTGYIGSSSDGATQLADSHGLTATYTSASTGGHINQVAQIPVAASGSTTFTLALAFDSSQSAAVSDASASLSAGFASAESSFESGWHSWLAGLSAPPGSVTGNSQLEAQYYVSLMELKADEDKTYVGGFVAAPTDPWGGAVSANSGGDHGYHVVWTRDEYEMATALLAAGDRTDALDALHYILNYEVESSGDVKQNSWLNGTAVWNGTQMDEVADPLILAYQLGDTSSSDWAKLKPLAGYLVSNGPYTQEERWEEQGGYSPPTMAAEVAGLVCASVLANDNGDSTDASTYQSTADNFESDVDTDAYTTSGPYGNGDYYVRITPDGKPNAGTSISLANGGGTYDDRDVVDPGFLELVRLGVKSATAQEITNSITAVDQQDETTINDNQYWGRYNHDGYGETASGGDYTGAGVGRDWPVLSGERGEYDVAAGNTSGAQNMLQAMAAAANQGHQISEQIWNTASADGFTEGQPDNSSTPLMWAMAQYVRLAVDISAGKDVDTPAVVATRYADSGANAGSVAETVDVTVPATTDGTGEQVYLAGNLSALGENAPDWSPEGVVMTRVSATEWRTTLHAASDATLSYKYDIGGSWNTVEETSGCGYVANRSMSVNGGTQSDTVANWQGVGSC